MGDFLTHTRSCPFPYGNDDPCTCALRERILLEAENAMSVAWQKQAEEALAKVKELTEQLASMTRQFEAAARCNTQRAAIIEKVTAERGDLRALVSELKHELNDAGKRLNNLGATSLSLTDAVKKADKILGVSPL